MDFFSKKIFLKKPFESFSQLFIQSATFQKPKGCKKIAVSVIGAGGGGGAGGGMVMWGGTGGIGGKVVKEFTASELKALPFEIAIVVGIGGYGGPGRNSSFSNVVAYGGTRGGDAGYGWSGSPGANGSGENGIITIGTPEAERIYNGVVYGSGGGGTQGGGGGYQGIQGCVYVSVD